MTTFHSTEKWLNWVDTLSDDNYVVIDDFLSRSQYEVITHFFQKKLDDFAQAGIGALDQNRVIKGIRGDSTYWLDSKRDLELQSFWDLSSEVIHILNRYCFLSISGFEFHLAHYPPGGFYQRHLDQFQGRNNRMISVVIYLNDHWQPGDGGELELLDKNDHLQVIQPIARRCVLFKSADVEHGVLEANKDRFSLTGWLLHHPAPLGQFFG